MADVALPGSDHYRRLGVARFASERRVRHAYISLMKRHHDPLDPLSLSDDELRTTAAAYWELRHPERRARYDAALRRRDRHERARAVVRLETALSRSVRRTPRRSGRAIVLVSLLLLGGGIAVVASLPPLPRAPVNDDPADRPSASLAAIRRIEDDAIVGMRAYYVARTPFGDVRHQPCAVDARGDAPPRLRSYCASLRDLELMANRTEDADGDPAVPPPPRR